MTPFPEKTPILLAPMAGYTDSAFRLLCSSCGCDLAYTEMVSAKGLHYLNGRTHALLAIDPAETRVAVQLFGSDAAVMAEQAEVLCDALGERLTLIDINMGCPANKIVKNGEGSALMQTPEKAADIVAAVAKRSRVPVTVKFRAGWDAQSVNAPAFAQRMEESGAAAVTVHGRTRMQQYSGTADLAVIAAVKARVHIPVIGNGDVRDGPSALAMLNETGCDGLMIARGALGNPFVFEQVRAAVAGTPYAPPTERQRREMAARHVDMVLERKGEHGLVELRKHIPYYVAGMRGAARLRTALMGAATAADLRALLLDMGDGRTYN